jgi:excisionase family DNA binding protein
MTKLLNVEQVAELTGWKPSTIRQKVWRREIDYLKLGRSIRFKLETIERLIEASAVPALETRNGGVQ